MRITRRCTLISLSAIVSQNRLNPIMQRAKIDKSVRRALPVNDNGFSEIVRFSKPTVLIRLSRKESLRGYSYP